MNLAHLKALEHYVTEIETAARIIQEMHNTAGILEIAAWIEERAEKTLDLAQALREKQLQIAYDEATP